jgi:hypothetical protein
MKLDKKRGGQNSISDNMKTKQKRYGHVQRMTDNSRLNETEEWMSEGSRRE